MCPLVDCLVCLDVVVEYNRYDVFFVLYPLRYFGIVHFLEQNFVRPNDIMM